MKKPKLNEKGKIAYMCVAFIVLAISLTLFRTAQNSAKKLINSVTSTSDYSFTVTKMPSEEPADTPVTDVPDTRKAETTASPETKPKTTEAATVFNPLDYFVSPVNGKILNHFSNGELVKNEGTGDWRTHNGTDIASDSGTIVVAVNNGVVTAVYNDALWGTVVEIDHGNKVTAKYCGLSENTRVKKGDTVKSGEEIGTLFAIPIESNIPTHLHIEMRSGGALINPIDLFQ